MNYDNNNNNFNNTYNMNQGPMFQPMQQMPNNQPNGNLYDFSNDINNNVSNNGYSNENVEFKSSKKKRFSFFALLEFLIIVFLCLYIANDKGYIHIKYLDNLIPAKEQKQEEPKEESKTAEAKKEETTVTDSPPIESFTGEPSSDAVLLGLSVLSGPDRSTYTVGESFDPTGMVLALSYSDGSLVQANGWSWEPAGALGTEDSFVIIRYGEGSAVQSTTLAIHVWPEEEPDASHLSFSEGHGGSGLSVSMILIIITAVIVITAAAILFTAVGRKVRVFSAADNSSRRK